jgi:formylmethanofuran dehydrogenase subunit E
MAFSFYRRGDNKAVRLFFESTLLTGGDPEFVELNGRWLRGEATQEEMDRLMAMREERSQRIMDAPLEEVFEVKEPTDPMPRTARILDSLVCEECGEGTMETRTRRLEGRTLCQSCFNALEKRQ